MTTVIDAVSFSTQIIFICTNNFSSVCAFQDVSYLQMGLRHFLVIASSLLNFGSFRYQELVVMATLPVDHIEGRTEGTLLMTVASSRMKDRC